MDHQSLTTSHWPPVSDHRPRPLPPTRSVSIKVSHYFTRVIQTLYTHSAVKELTHSQWFKVTHTTWFMIVVSEKCLMRVDCKTKPWAALCHSSLFTSSVQILQTYYSSAWRTAVNLKKSFPAAPCQGESIYRTNDAANIYREEMKMKMKKNEVKVRFNESELFDKDLFVKQLDPK